MNAKLDWTLLAFLILLLENVVLIAVHAVDPWPEISKLNGANLAAWGQAIGSVVAIAASISVVRILTRRKPIEKVIGASLVAAKYSDLIVQMLERLLFARAQIRFSDTVFKCDVEHVAEALAFATVSFSKISRGDLLDLTILPNRASDRIEKAAAIFRSLNKDVSHKSVNFMLSPELILMNKHEIALFKSWEIPLGKGLELLSLANIELTKVAKI